MPKLINVREAVSAASMEIGITQKPLDAAMGSPDADVVQMAALLNAIADELLLEDPYQEVLGDGNWLLTEAGEAVDRPQQDTDIILFDGRLAINGLKYRFLQAKGLEFGEQLRDFVNRLNKVAVRSNNRVLDLDVEWGRVQ